MREARSIFSLDQPVDVYMQILGKLPPVHSEHSIECSEPKLTSQSLNAMIFGTEPQVKSSQSGGEPRELET
ncbi:hypothetical protein HYFRA_00005025 [Hymenoscyphus fraxineus]|uniref:Uncharacterized protein n=1 Tax=Hymenoscyphus fraxineus TaxID=746836 RepID=A0A9N9KLX7_9HELO|nr:hypothetical protein HYFRA_00005025 [Hymenoscyphus fraxineus]